MAAAFPITSEVAANISSVAGDVAYRVVNFQTVPPRYRINLVRVVSPPGSGRLPHLFRFFVESDANCPELLFASLF